MAGQAALQAEMGLTVDAEAPLFTVVSRLTEQKGMPLVLSGLQEILSRGGQLLVLGNGDTQLEQAFALQAKAHPRQVAFRMGYDEAFAHSIFAASDVTATPTTISTAPPIITGRSAKRSRMRGNRKAASIDPAPKAAKASATCAA
mgnify:CR=1 FL=1